MKYVYILTAFALLAVMAGCSKKKETVAAPVIPVKAVPVSSKGGVSGNHYVGTIEEVTGTQVSFEVPGNIRSLTVGEGDRVVKGQALGTVDPATLREAYKAQHAQAQQARDAYRRFKQLHKEGTVADIKWVEVESKLSQAVAAEQMAKEQLGKTTMYAPFSGVISQKTADVGMNVLPGQQVFKLVTLDRVYVTFSVPENEVASLKIGLTVRFAVSALDNRAFTARITEIGVAADPLSHTYKVKAVLANPGGRLMPGMVCDVQMEQGTDNGDGRIVIPVNCVQLDADNRRFVWVVQGGKAYQRYITTGDFTDNGVVVNSGLTDGDLLITEGAQKVSDGMKVKVQ